MAGYNTTEDVATSMAVFPEEEDSLSFLETQPNMAVPYIGALVIGMFIGVIGNILILVATYIEKRLRHEGYEFIINLAIADLVVVSAAGPLCIIGATQGRQWFEERMWLCETIASMCITSCSCAFLSLGALTLSKYCFILHRHIYDLIFSKTKTIIICVLVWLLAFVTESANFVGWGDHTFDRKSQKCTWDRAASVSYTVFLAVGLLGTPLIGMLTAYIIIFWRIFQTKHNLFAFQETIKREARLKAIQETVHTCRMMFVVVIAFIVCWTPYIIVVVVDLKDRLPLWLHLWVTYLSHSHSSINWLIYACAGKVYRQIFWRIFSCSSKDDEGISSSSGDKYSHRTQDTKDIGARLASTSDLEMTSQSQHVAGERY